jgi:hypothetical protein
MRENARDIYKRNWYAVCHEREFSRVYIRGTGMQYAMRENSREYRYILEEMVRGMPWERILAIYCILEELVCGMPWESILVIYIRGTGMRYAMRENYREYILEEMVRGMPWERIFAIYIRGTGMRYAMREIFREYILEEMVRRIPWERILAIYCILEELVCGMPPCQIPRAGLYSCLHQFQQTISQDSLIKFFLYTNNKDIDKQNLPLVNR